MINKKGDISLTQVLFEGNTAFSGGGLHSYLGSASLVDVTFLGNDSLHSGGGLYTYQSDSDLQQVTFTNNISHSLGGGYSSYF